MNIHTTTLLPMVKRLVPALLLLLTWTAGAVADTAINGARIWPAPDHTRVVFETGGNVKHNVFALSNPARLVIDISDASLQADFNRLDLTGSPIQRIRSGKRNGNDLRVVLDLNEDIKPRSFQLKPNEQYGYRLVVDLIDEKGAKKTPRQKPTLHDGDAGKRDVIVVIDPGHGGEDPGAIGPRGTREKDIVLKLSKSLVDLINSKPGYTAKMTRTGDYYVGLRDRTVLARKHNADLFVSVHADAFRTSRPKGASVFALSQRGATSETARWLASTENSADLIGGVGGVSLHGKDDTLAGVLLDLSMTASINASVGVGSHVLRQLGGITQLHKSGVEQAAFVVLKSPDIPSILVEAGFISNPEEERNLGSSQHRAKLARAVFSGIESYFQATPPPGTLLAWNKRQGSGASNVSQYKIRQGDTLSAVARRNQISVNDLMRHNDLNDDHVMIGQTLQIPAS